VLLLWLLSDNRESFSDRAPIPNLEVMSARNPTRDTYVAFVMKFRLMTMTSISCSLSYSMVWLQKEPEHGVTETTSNTDQFFTKISQHCKD